jgi:hypothetical protein
MVRSARIMVYDLSMLISGERGIGRKLYFDLFNTTLAIRGSPF